MAVLSDYTSGTITLANGSTAVTGTGTLFDVAKFREGDTLQIQNLTAVIASVNTDTSLTLTSPWTGTSLTNAPYRARYLPDGARVTAQATTLIELLGNGVLTNLAELGVEDGKVPVGNAAGQYELVDTSTFGLQDPNGSLGKLATLVLAANKFLSTNGHNNLVQSDITAAAIALLNLSGTAAADRLPYLNGANGSALTPLTAVARNLLDDTTTAGQRVTLGIGRPAFKATNSTATALSNGSNTIPFSQVAMNVGNGWNGQIFTAPESGIYIISVDYVISGGVDNAGNTILSLYRDGFWYQETVRARRTDYFHSIDLSTAVYLNAGQTFQSRVTLENWAGTVTASAGRCTISGALIG